MNDTVTCGLSDDFEHTLWEMQWCTQQRVKSRVGENTVCGTCWHISPKPSIHVGKKFLKNDLHTTHDNSLFDLTFYMLTIAITLLIMRTNSLHNLVKLINYKVITVFIYTSLCVFFVFYYFYYAIHGLIFVFFYCI